MPAAQHTVCFSHVTLQNARGVRCRGTHAQQVNQTIRISQLFFYAKAGPCMCSLKFSRCCKAVQEVKPGTSRWHGIRCVCGKLHVQSQATGHDQCECLLAATVATCFERSFQPQGNNPMGALALSQNTQTVECRHRVHACTWGTPTPCSSEGHNLSCIGASVDPEPQAAQACLSCQQLLRAGVSGAGTTVGACCSGRHPVRHELHRRPLAPWSQAAQADMYTGHS